VHLYEKFWCLPQVINLFVWRKSLQGCQGASYCAFAQFGIMCKWHAVYAYSVCTRCTTCVQVYATRAPVRLCASLFTAFRSTSADRVKVMT